MPFVFLDHADVDDALGYHDLTKTGAPVTFVFVKTTLDDGGDVAVTASHELWEVLVDPAIQLWAENAEGTLRAYETADAVEETDFLVDDVRISNFVYPSFFESFRKPKSTKFDHLGLVDRPFKLLKGSYTLLKDGKKVTQIFGSKEKEVRFGQESRKLHRSEDRGVPLTKRLEKLEAKKGCPEENSRQKSRSENGCNDQETKDGSCLVTQMTWGRHADQRLDASTPPSLPHWSLHNSTKTRTTGSSSFCPPSFCQRFVPCC